MKKSRHQNPRDPREAGFLPSHSFLKMFQRKTPAEVLYERLNKPPQTPAMAESSAIEMMLNNEAGFSEKFEEGNPIDESTKTFQLVKAFYELKKDPEILDPYAEALKAVPMRLKVETFQEKHEGGDYDNIIKQLLSKDAKKVILPSSTMENVHKIVEFLKKESPIMDIVKSSEIEPQLIWKNPETGVKLLGFPDYVKRKNRHVLDLKCMYDIDPVKMAGKGPFSSTFAQYGYHSQLGAYIQGLGWGIEDSTATIFAVKKTEPYGWKMFDFGYTDLMEGQEALARWCATYKTVSESDLWNAGYQFAEEWEIEAFFTENGDRQMGMKKRLLPEIYTTEMFE
jgi:hypothetical protein